MDEISLEPSAESIGIGAGRLITVFGKIPVGRFSECTWDSKLCTKACAAHTCRLFFSPLSLPDRLS